jgi:hypothetical protein
MLGFAPLAAVPLAARESFAPFTISFTAVLAAIESVDVALFAGSMFNAPVDGIVGVIEDAVPPAAAVPVAASASVNISIRERAVVIG